MYYRRKFVLALIETFGGSLGATDCQKLIFLFCQQTQHNYYDFFPHKFGAYSFTLNQDRLRLTDLGYLKSDDSYTLTRKQQFLTQVDAFTQAELLSFAQKYEHLRGDELLRFVYREYPYFASKSIVASRLLPADELTLVERQNNVSSEPILFTIGYEGITIDSYLNMLIKNNVRVLVDVRKNPISKKYGFSKSQLQRHIESIGLSYLHLPDLGIPANLRRDLNTEEAYQQLFRQYEREILPKQEEALQKLRETVYSEKRVALTCFEASYKSCHRSKIAEHFERDRTFEIPIKHLGEQDVSSR